MKCDECARLLQIFRDAVDIYSVAVRRLQWTSDAAQFRILSEEVTRCRKVAEPAAVALDNHKREEHAA
jgi:hypothetical protein